MVYNIGWLPSMDLQMASGEPQMSEIALAIKSIYEFSKEFATVRQKNKKDLFDNFITPLFVKHQIVVDHYFSLFLANGISPVKWSNNFVHFDR